MEMIPYYTMHPSLGVTAVVHAPSTEKARTTFLDWLERNGFVKRDTRQLLRKDMVAEKLEDPNVKSDVVLHYGYQDTTVIGGGLGAGFEERGPVVEGEFREIPPGEEVDVPLGKWEEVPLSTEALDLPKKGPKMPIQRVMLGGFSR